MLGVKQCDKWTGGRLHLILYSSEVEGKLNIVYLDLSVLSTT